MMLFGSSARLTRLTTSQALPISVGTSSASPARVAPWQAVIEPPYFRLTSAISRLQATQPAQVSSSRRDSQMPTSISTR